MNKTVIVSAKRTPIGAFMGVLSAIPATKLGSIAIKAALETVHLKPEAVEEVIMGNVITAGEGQSPARQALLGAGLPLSTAALTVGKVCGSGLKAVMLADQIIRSGDASVIVAGGMENMSLAPHAWERSRSGLRLGDAKIVDLMIKDGLWDPYGNCHMGTIAEKCVTEHKVSRTAQDEFAKNSYLRAQAAIKAGKFKDEIAVVSVTQKKGDALLVDTDEEPARGNVEKLSDLKPAFDNDGSVTAGNASSISDGAAAVVVMSEQKAKELGMKPLVKILAHAQVSQAPDWFTTAPALAIEKVLKQAKLSVEQIDLWEINEAFAVVSLVNNTQLKISADKVNVNGGAVALGHPIGASGARILVTLIHEMQRRPQVKRGVASLCIGGGEAVAMVIEKV